MNGWMNGVGSAREARKEAREGFGSFVFVVVVLSCLACCVELHRVALPIFHRCGASAL